MARFHALKQKLFLEKTPRWQCKEVMFPLPLLLPWLVLLPPFCPLWSKPSWRKCFSASVLKANSIISDEKGLLCREQLCSVKGKCQIWDGKAHCSAVVCKRVGGKEFLWQNFAMTKEMKTWSCPHLPMKSTNTSGKQFCTIEYHLFGSRNTATEEDKNT